MKERYQYYLEEECGVLGVRELCMVSFGHATVPLVEHVHPDVIEICFLYRGRQTYQVQGDLYQMHGMDVFMTYPN